MKDFGQKSSKELTEHFFRNEYGKIVSVLTRFIGSDHVETAEDIAQETLLKAYDSWQHNGIPENPRGWLYTTAKNLTLNSLKRKKYQNKYVKEVKVKDAALEELWFSEEHINDEQLRMMFVCCHPSVSENSQITLILKILCGFSITEIAHAFFSTYETINKRLVRGRGQLRENNVKLDVLERIDDNLPIILKAIYLLFNEGYSPSQKSEVVRYDLCMEAIRLTEILVSGSIVYVKADCYALLALMYLNASRFEARMNHDDTMVDMEKQDRKKWNRSFIRRGVNHLQQATNASSTSKYLILAAISANHSVAPSFKETNWKEILSLYDNLVVLEDSPIARLNRAVALAKARGNEQAIEELMDLASKSDIDMYYLFHATLGELYKDQKDPKNAICCYKKAIDLADNDRDKKLLKKKLMDVVPIL